MKDMRPTLMLFIAFTLLLGGAYPLIVTGIAQLAFPSQASGSFIADAGGVSAGSRLIGQPFTGAKYFWPRPSATDGFPYNPMASGGSNAGPTTPGYLGMVAQRVRAYRESGVTRTVPAELVQASASGLDPDISPHGAAIQAERVARARGMQASDLERLIAAHTRGRQLGFIGEPRVNVLELNLALDALK